MRQRSTIHQLKLPSQWHAVGDAGGDQAFVVQQLGDVMGGGFAFDRRVGGEDDFRERARLFDPRDQLWNADGFRPQAVERGQMALEHEITATKTGLLHRIHIHRPLHDAKQGVVPTRVMLSRLMLRTSARNQLHGKVLGIEAQGHNDRVRLELARGLVIEARITHDSTLRLELAVGTDVVALIKAGWLELHPVEQAEKQGINTLRGMIEQVDAAEDGPSEVRIGLPNGQTLCALADPLQLQAQDLAAGSPVQVTFSATNVLLGTPL